MKPLPFLNRQLRTLRDRAGLTQQELAAKAGVSISVVFQIEQGKRTDPRINTLSALARALGVSVAAFVEREESDRPRRGK